MGHLDLSNLESCPGEHATRLNIDYPSTTILSFLLFLLSLILSFWIELNYNSVIIFQAKKRTATVSNNHWCFFFISSSLSFLFESIEFGSDSDSGSEVLTFLSFLFHGFSGLFLSLALNHQLKYRSRGSQPIIAKAKQERSSWRTFWKRELYGSINFMCWLLFAYYLAALLYQRSKENEDIAFALLGSMFSIQRVPALVIGFLICRTRDIDGRGPPYRTRAYLAIGLLLYLATCLPTLLWAEFLPKSCTFSFANWEDFFRFFNGISLVILIWFVRKEYIRNQEACVWATVSQTQTFDTQPF